VIVPASADAVIVGVGTAGAILAARLARASMSVVALEAGPDPGPSQSAFWPVDLVDSEQVGTSHDWGYSGPAADERVLAFPRARVIGGCSSHNGCTQSIGWRGDWDAWGLINPGWGSREIERHRSRSIEELRIWQPSKGDLQPFQGAFLDAAISLNIPHHDDLLDLDGGPGIAISPVNIVDNMRWNSAFAHLDPVRNLPNLTICANSIVDRIELNSRHNRGLAVHALIEGRRTRIAAGRIVLCAGVYGTPEVLLRSGIGPADHLRRLGVDVESNLPGVGENLHDQPTAVRSFEAAPELARELDNALRVPDEQVLAKLSTGLDPAGAPYDLHVFPWTEPDPSLQTGWRLVVPVALLRPASRGALRLRSPDPAVRARAEHAFLTDPTDVERLTIGLAALDPILAKLPLGQELQETPTSDLATWLRRHHEHYWHPVGTCAMGENQFAVVDTRGMVRGLDNVQIADASIFPDTPRSTIAFPVVLIAEQMAQITLGT
jgi:choline dehydrogenase